MTKTKIIMNKNHIYTFKNNYTKKTITLTKLKNKMLNISKSFSCLLASTV